MGQNTEITAADGHRLSAYAAGAADAPRALVVVQEIFGVNPHMRHVADRLAAAGYQVLSPALFDRIEPGVELGYSEADVQRGLELRAKIPQEALVADVEACAKTLAMGGRKVGIIGYCWGGTVSWIAAAHSTQFAAAVGWYGGGIAAMKDEELHCPVQLHFGATDASIPVEDIAAIRAAHPDVECFVYPGAGHAFGNDDRPSFHEASNTLAEQRSLEFFTKHLT